MSTEKKYIDRKEQSARAREKYNIEIAVSTLAGMATRGGGPKYVRVGHRALSTAEWFDEWMESRISEPRRNTSEAV